MNESLSRTGSEVFSGWTAATSLSSEPAAEEAFAAGVDDDVDADGCAAILGQG